MGPVAKRRIFLSQLMLQAPPSRSKRWGSRSKRCCGGFVLTLMGAVPAASFTPVPVLLAAGTPESPRGNPKNHGGTRMSKSCWWEGSGGWVGFIYWKVLSYTGNSYICPPRCPQPGGQVRGDIEVVKKNFGPARGGTPKIMVGHGCPLICTSYAPHSMSMRTEPTGPINVPRQGGDQKVILL